VGLMGEKTIICIKDEFGYGTIEATITMSKYFTRKEIKLGDYKGFPRLILEKKVINNKNRNKHLNYLL
jgi:hypothetical protein